MSLLLLILVGASYPFTGLGIDWGSVHSDGIFTFIEAVELSSPTDKSSHKFPFCEITSRRLITRKGNCSYFSTCKVGKVFYFGPFCDGVERGSSCQVKTKQLLSVQGSCSPAGHCKGPLGKVALNHESCRQDTKEALDVKNEAMDNNTTENLKDPIEKYVDSTPSYSKCRGLHNPSVYQKLKNICNDCYNLYKNHDVHILCMSECFGSIYFISCVKSLMMEQDRVERMVNMLGK